MGRPKEIIDPEIGKRLAILIRNMKDPEGKKITYKKFSDFYGVTSQAVYTWVSGTRKVPSYVISDMRKQFNVDDQLRPLHELDPMFQKPEFPFHMDDMILISKSQLKDLIKKSRTILDQLEFYMNQSELR